MPTATEVKAQAPIVTGQQPPAMPEASPEQQQIEDARKLIRRAAKMCGNTTFSDDIDVSLQKIPGNCTSFAAILNEMRNEHDPRKFENLVERLMGKDQLGPFHTNSCVHSEKYPSALALAQDTNFEWNNTELASSLFQFHEQSAKAGIERLTGENPESRDQCLNEDCKKTLVHREEILCEKQSLHLHKGTFNAGMWHKDGSCTYSSLMFFGVFGDSTWHTSFAQPPETPEASPKPGVNSAQQPLEAVKESPVHQPRPFLDFVQHRNTVKVAIKKYANGQEWNEKGAQFNRAEEIDSATVILPPGHAFCVTWKQKGLFHRV